MVILPLGSRIPIEWVISKNDCVCREDFSRVGNLCVFLCGTSNKYPIEHLVNSKPNGCEKLILTLPSNLVEDVYSIEAIWHKDAKYKRSYSKVLNVFAISSSARPVPPESKIRIKSSVSSYGYDGLSAYELAVLKGLTKLSENEWVGNVAELNEKVDDLIRGERDAYNKAVAYGYAGTWDDWVKHLVQPIEIVDSLDSERTDAALSARKGKELNDRLAVVETDVRWVNMDAKDE